ncbi:MAG: FG-GAP-like repeat-containing protein, partial [Candidatus Omnitrophota bacterium]|nr:FG-GAP-like repeat-containing protein [Candidatus Omnitrophota bacterium]
DSKVYVYDLSGQILQGWPVKPPQTYNSLSSGASLWDINNDGKLEIATCATYGGCSIYDYRGNLIVQFNAPGLSHNSPAIGDIDRDGQAEIVFGTYNQPGGPFGHDGMIYAFRIDGSLLPGNWPVNTPGFIANSPALADINGDGYLEVIAGAGDGRVYCIDKDGNHLPGWPYQTWGQVWSCPAIGDIDEDGELEIIVGSADAKIHAIKADGSPVPGWPFNTQPYVQGSAVIGDINDDGRIEVIAQTQPNSEDSNRYSYIYVWSLGHGQKRASWPMYMHDSQHTGNINRPPHLIIPPIIPINEGEFLQFTIIATDQDNDPLIFVNPTSGELAEAAPGASFVDNGNGTATFTWTPNYTQGRVNPYIIHFEVLDGSLTDIKDVNITVSNVLTMGTIYGNISGGGTIPLEGATVTIMDLAKTSVLATCLTDSDSKFSIASNSIPDGNYYIIISKYGYHPYEAMVTLINNQILAFSVTLAIDSTPSVITVLKNGAGAAGFHIEAYDINGNCISSSGVPTDNDGKVSCGLEEGMQVKFKVSDRNCYGIESDFVTTPANVTLSLPHESIVTVSKDERGIEYQGVQALDESGSEIAFNMSCWSGEAYFFIKEGLQVKFVTHYLAKMFSSDYVTTPGDATIQIDDEPPNYISFEAEDMSNVTQEIGYGADAWAGAYIQCEGTGKVSSHTFNVPEDGNYTIWLRIAELEDNPSNPVVIEVNGSQFVLNSEPGGVSSEFGWIDFEDGSPVDEIIVPLMQGEAAFTINEGASLAKIDSIIITNDLTYAPPAT